MKNSANAIKRLTTVLLMALCLFSIAIPAVATDTPTAPDQANSSYSIPVTCYWCQLKLSIEDGSYLISHIASSVLLLLLSSAVLYIVRKHKIAKLIAVSAFLPQILLICLAAVISLGHISVTHSTGPVIMALEVTLHLLSLFLNGTAYVIYQRNASAKAR